MKDVASENLGDLAFEEFMSARQRPLLRFAMVLTGNAPLAEDIVSDALGRAWERWDRIAAMAEPNAYVRRMIVNEYLAWGRRGRRVTPRGDLTPLIDIDRVGHDPATTITERDALISALAELPRKQRAALVLRFYEGLPDAEIAAILGCGQGAVRSNTSRALATLRINFGASAPGDAPASAAPPVASAPLALEEI